MRQLVIDRLGQKGDGLVAEPGGVVSVPLALPGETVTVTGDPPVLARIEHPSPHRATPICPLFGTCGGCTLQHAGDVLIAGWKREQVQAALAHAGLEAPVAATVDAHGAGRRRVTWHLRRQERVWRAGFMARGSHQLVTVPDCPILVTPLRKSASLAEALGTVLGGLDKPLDVQITATATGLDVDLRGAGKLAPKQEQALIAEAGQLDLARLALHGRVLVERRPPQVAMGPAQVSPPAGGFLQATETAEDILAGLVLDALDQPKRKVKRVADLFAGAGPFALRLATRFAIHAVETEAAAVAALSRAARGTPGLKPVTTETRDLYRRPLLEPELAGFDAVVLDPPRNGAEMQCQRLAAAKVPLVAYVSCDARSFSRDAALLVRGGFRLTGVTPVDQFRYAPHVELVGTFTRTA